MKPSFPQFLIDCRSKFNVSAMASRINQKVLMKEKTIIGSGIIGSIPWTERNYQ